MQEHVPSSANAAGNRFRHAEAVEATRLENGPVIDYSNTGDPMYANSWIAEVVIAYGWFPASYRCPVKGKLEKTRL
jgi:hypothetical protein